MGSTSGSASGPSEPAGVDCGRLETSAGHDIGSISTSGLLAKSTDNSWSGPEGDSYGVSNTAGGTSGWSGLVVKDPSISTGSSVVLGISAWGSATSVIGAGSCIGGGVSIGAGSGGEMSTIANAWSWKTDWEVCVS